MPDFYKIDSTSMSVEEMWWAAKRNPLLFPFAALYKLRKPSQFSSDDANVESTYPFITESLPAEIETQFAGIRAEVEALGFCEPVFHYYFDSGNFTHLYWATFRHESGQHWARLHTRHWDIASPRIRALFVLFFTSHADATFFVSSSGKRDTSAPQAIKMNRLPNAPVNKLWASHLRQSTVFGRGKTVMPVWNSQETFQHAEWLHSIQRDYHLQRKFFRPPTEKEAAEMQRHLEKLGALQNEGAHYPHELAEISHLETARQDTRQGLWILILSVIAFTAAGAASWGKTAVLWLIPILFFHEFGHWLTMKIFGYRNMRMFFIPLFGAAVSGKHYNVAGWKKAVVSLAGPVPGIFVGTGLLIVSLLTHVQFLRQGAFYLILINGINLIPVLPLDGGHFFQATIFSRNRWLEFSFRVLTIVSLVALGLTGFFRFGLYLAIALGLSLPLGIKLGKVTDRLRAGHLPPPPTDAGISQATAERIIGELKKELSKVGARQIAQCTLSTYETLNARPPGLLATLGLLAVYIGAFAAVGVSFLLWGISSAGGLGGLASMPRHLVTPAKIRSWHGSESSAPEIILAATGKASTSTLQTIFSRLTNELPPTANALLFGDSIIIGLGSNDEAGFAQSKTLLHTLSQNLIVSSNGLIGGHFHCIARDEIAASNLNLTLASYFNAGVRNLIPPWSPEAQNPELAGKFRARQFWNTINSRLGAATSNDYAIMFRPKNPPDTNLPSRLDVMKKLGEKIRADRQAEMKRIVIEYHHTEFEPLVRLAERWGNRVPTNQMANASLEKEIENALARKKDDETNYFPGFSSHQALIVQFTKMDGLRPDTDLPQIVEWLTKEHCLSIRYQLDDPALDD